MPCNLSVPVIFASNVLFDLPFFASLPAYARVLAKDYACG